MSRAFSPSFVILPHLAPPYPSLLDFLDERFSSVGRENWLLRITAGNVWYAGEEAITVDTLFRPQAKLYYYREVSHEQPIPFNETVIYQDEHILVVDKPHFLPVVPAGRFVNESLLYRLKRKTGIDDLSPIHRIDMDTAGLVVFSVDKKNRGVFQSLFLHGGVHKVYHAIAVCSGRLDSDEWLVEKRIVRGEPWFRMKIVEGLPNSRTRIRLLDRNEDSIFLHLEPYTGKKHQLRLHICSQGWQIKNDRYYPVLQPEDAPDYSAPLQLLAQSIAFTNPISGNLMSFESGLSLALEDNNRSQG